MSNFAYVTDASDLLVDASSLGDFTQDPSGQWWAETLFGKIKTGAPHPTSFLGDLGRSVSSGVSTIAKAIPKDPLTTLAKGVLSGQRLDRALAGAVKEATSNLKTFGPYAQMVASMVPGLGTGVAAAIGAATALANGQRIDDALIAGAKGALPGGPLAAAAFDTAIGLAKGQSISSAALSAARNRLPPGPAQAAFDVGLAMAHGQNLQEAALAGARSQMPPVAQQALDLGMAAARGQLTEEAKRLARAQLPPDAQRVFDAGVDVVKGRPLAQVLQTVGKGSPAMRALSQLNPLAGLGQIAPTALSLLPSNVDMAAKSILRDPRLRSLTPDRIAQVLNVHPTVARRAVASVIDLARRAGTPGAVLKHAPDLERALSMSVPVDKLLAGLASRAAPSARNSSPRGRRKPVFSRRVHNYFMRTIPHVAPLIDAASLDATGTGWIVSPGESPAAIATKVVGDERRYPELIAANPQKKTNGQVGLFKLNFASLQPGERLNLPLSWIKGAPGVASAPPLPTSVFGVPLPGGQTTAIPGVGPVPDIFAKALGIPQGAPAPQQAPSSQPTFFGIPIPTLPPGNVPGGAPDTTAVPTDQIIRAKVMLTAWGVRERAIQPVGYGSNFLDLDGSLDERFLSAVRSYQKWADDVRGESLRTDGRMDDATMQSLTRYTTAAASAPIPGAPPISIPGVTPGAPALPLPSPIALPTPTQIAQSLPTPGPIGGIPAAPSAAPASSSGGGGLIPIVLAGIIAKATGIV